MSERSLSTSQGTSKHWMVCYSRVQLYSPTFTFDAVSGSGKSFTVGWLADQEGDGKRNCHDVIWCHLLIFAWYISLPFFSSGFWSPLSLLHAFRWTVLSDLKYLEMFEFEDSQGLMPALASSVGSLAARVDLCSSSNWDCTIPSEIDSLHVLSDIGQKTSNDIFHISIPRQRMNLITTTRSQYSI